MADRPGIVGKFSHRTFQILSFAQGEKIGPCRPNESIAVDWASGTNFFDRHGLRVSLTQALKNEEAI